LPVKYGTPISFVRCFSRAARKTAHKEEKYRSAARPELVEGKAKSGGALAAIRTARRFQTPMLMDDGCAP
jgi:hypothetical protein